MVGEVNKSKSVSAAASVALVQSRDSAMEREKERIQSPEFTEHLIVSFHRSKRRALSRGKQDAVLKA
jgi:hypothetical protein